MLRYDSSIFPIYHDRYGIPDYSQKPHEIRPGFHELPLSTVSVGRMCLPVGGGGYLRLYTLAKVITTLYEDKKACDELGTNGRKYMEQTYSFQDIYSKYRDLFEKVSESNKIMVMDCESSNSDHK